MKADKVTQMMMPKLLTTISVIFSSNGSVVCMTNSSHIWLVIHSFCSRTSDFQLFSCLECLLLTYVKVIIIQAEVLCIYRVVNVKHINVLLQTILTRIV